VLITDLIGRERDLAALEEVLLHGARILSLTGPGGVGKTSLVVRLAATVSRQYPDGVTFVPLAPVGDAALVLPTIARALQIPEAGARDARVALREHLHGKRTLLILDNVEQVLDAAPEIAALVSSADGLTVIVTSRAPLRVRGEREYPVPPLEVPDLRRVPEVQDVAGNPAVALFVERARAAVPSFELSRDNAAVIAAICRRLDGLPLAIELAAPRVRVLTPMMLLSRLDSALPLLSGGARDLPERQRTMRRTIEWSHDLLGTPERTLLHALSVFRGGWSIDAAEAVAAGDEEPADDVLGAMASLVEQSLVATTTHVDGSTRYRLLVPVREFAEEHLDNSGRAGATRRRHADHYVALTGQAATELTGPRQVEWLARLDVERDNLRAALGYLLEVRDWEAAARMGWNLWVFWWIRGYHAEGRTWMGQLLAEGSEAAPGVRAMALGISGAMALGQGDIAYAGMCADESSRLFGAVGDQLAGARSGLVRGLLASAGGDIERATVSLQEAADVFREAGAHFWAALAISALGMLPFRQGQLDRAEALLAEGHTLARMAGDTFSRYITLYNQARLALARGEYVTAAELYLEGLMYSLEVGDRANVAYCMEGLAAVAVGWGSFAWAARLLAGAATLFDAVGTRVYTYRPDTSLREHTTATVRAQLGEDGWATAWDEGRILPMEDVILEATALVARLRSEATAPGPRAQGNPGGLSDREVEVVRLVSAGLTNGQVADRLFVSRRTIDAHMRRIYDKLDLTARTEVVRFAHEHQLLQGTPPYPAGAGTG
jgi:non-specific serine/threonine protein kinase